MRAIGAFLVAVASLSLGGCATYLEDLDRAESHVTANEHEKALALFRVNERDIDSLSHPDQARYCYLRGMNDFRLGPAFRADARHWLAVARAIEKEHPGSLKAEWKERLEEALKDLNQDVYGTGVVAEETSEQGEGGAKEGKDKDEPRKERGKGDKGEKND
jgi:hypothetical protein